MKKLLGLVLVGGLGAGTLLAAGCASDGQTAKADTQTHAFASGMMCPTCETVWVRERTLSHHGLRYITRFNSKREMTCPTCDVTASQVLLEDGQVQLHECPECKATPMAIKPDKRPVSPLLGTRPR